MRKALLLIAVAGLVAAGCAPGTGLGGVDPIEPCEYGPVACMPMTGGATVPLAEDGILSAVRVGAMLSMAFPQDDEDVEWESTAFLIEGIVQVDLPMNFGIDGRIGYMTYENDEGSGELDMVPVSVMATYRFDLVPDTASLYLGLGLAFVFNDISEADEVDSVDDALGFKAALGANFNVGEHLTFGVDASYLRVGTDFDFETASDEEIDLDNVTVGVSIMGHF